MQRLERLIVGGLVSVACCGCDQTHPVVASSEAPRPIVEVEKPRVPVVRDIVLRGSAVVFGQGTPLKDAAICHDDFCVKTDDVGQFELPLPSRTEVVVAATRAGALRSLIPLHTGGEDFEIKAEIVPDVMAAAFASLADSEMRPETGLIFVNVRDEYGDGVQGAWLTIRDFAAWGPVYTRGDIVPDHGRESTGERGFGAFMELPDTIEEVGVRHPSRPCVPKFLSPNAEGLFELPSRPASVTWLNIECRTTDAAFD